MKNTALISTGNPQEIISTCHLLAELGWNFITTEETTKIFQNEKLPVFDIREFTGVGYQYNVPPTLHPKVEYALTENESNTEAIGLVFDVPYGLDVGNDVGGRTLLALGAKGNRFVINNQPDLVALVGLLQTNDVEKLESFRQDMIAKINLEISEHYLLLSKAHSASQTVRLSAKHVMRCLSGENPYQTPCDLFSINENERKVLSVTDLEYVSGEPMCFTNIADVDNLLMTLRKLKQAFIINFSKTPYIIVAGKHGNPCGIGIDWHSPEIAIKKALFGNPQAILGGEVICNFAIEKPHANILWKSALREELLGNDSWMLDVIGAPEFSKDAVSILGKRKRRKLFKHNELGEKENLFNEHDHFRFVSGGLLKQPSANYVLKFDELSGENQVSEDLESLIIAWAAAYTSFLGGNEIAIVKDSQLIGIGGGPSTVMATKHAVMCAHDCNHATKGSVFCADAFFPFTDAPEILKNAGCTKGAFPAGGKFFSDVQNFFQSSAIKTIVIPEEFRGFCRH